MNKLALALLGALLLPGFAQAVDGLPPAATPPTTPGKPVALVANMGFDFGSTTIVEVSLSDGSTQKLKANEGFFFSGGLSFLRTDWNASHLDTVATIGFKGWTVGADNASFHYMAFPFELKERINYEWFRAGLGITYQLGPQINSRGDFEGNDISLNSSLGLLTEVDWVSRPGPVGRWNIGARMIFQRLENADNGISVGANSFGLVLGWQAN